MPTILKEGPYRFYFFSHEPNEPAHVHVDRDNCSAKFWIDPADSIGLAKASGFTAIELRKIYRLVENHQLEFLRAWHEYFGPEI